MLPKADFNKMQTLAQNYQQQQQFRNNRVIIKQRLFINSWWQVDDIQFTVYCTGYL